MSSTSDESDDDDAAEARGYALDALRMLSRIAHQRDVDPDVRADAWYSLQFALVQLREFAATPGVPDDARAQVEATLRGFLDS